MVVQPGFCQTWLEPRRLFLTRRLISRLMSKSICLLCYVPTLTVHSKANMTHVMRKPVFCFAKRLLFALRKKVQISQATVQVDQHLCFSLPRYYILSSLHIRNFKCLASFCRSASKFVTDIGDRHSEKPKPEEHMSLVMRKPAFCICENKDADQLCDNREADQRLCFGYIDSTIPLLPKYKISSF